MGEGQPRGGRTGVHKCGLAFIIVRVSHRFFWCVEVPEVSPSVLPLLRSQVPNPDGVPADGILGFFVHHLMSQNEQLRMKI